MTRNKTGNNKFLKEFNQKAILDLIRIHNAISRAELSQLTGLSPTAIGIIASSLLEEGYIHETDIGESKGGRRPVLLELKPDSFYSVGVDLDVNYINIILMDITGKPVCERNLSRSENIGFEDTVIEIEDTVQKMLVDFSIETDKLLGIGMSIAGMVNNDLCKIVLAPNLGWKDISIKPFLKKFLNIPIFIENEAMSSAICENWIGMCQGINNFVCINVKSGIGAGIFTGGRLYRGTSGSAGEVGHIIVDENGPRCGCGNYGCLETLASTDRIVESTKKLIRQGVVSSLNAIENVDVINIDSIVQAAKDGDAASRSILLESARYLGLAISNIVNTLNPSKIILGKEFVKYSDIVLDYIKDVVEHKALKSPSSIVQIMASEIGERSSVLGAAIIPLKVFFGK